jgi:hypothetical protein
MTVAQVIGTDKDHNFDMHEYKSPVYNHREFMRTKKDTSLKKILYFSKLKDKPKCFVDKHAMLYKSNPGPQ